MRDFVLILIGMNIGFFLAIVAGVSGYAWKLYGVLTSKEQDHER